MSNKFKVVCYMRIDPEDGEGEPMDYDEAKAEIENLKLMQPENVYAIEQCDDDLIKCPNCLEDGFDPVARGCNLCEFDETNDPNTW